MRAAIPFVIFTVIGCGSGNSAKPVETGGEKPTGESTGSALKMPGDCVDPVSDGDRHDSTRPFDKHVQQDVRDEDLDGDGVVDAFVKPGWSCGESCKRSVYVVRGTCGHYVGTFPSMDKFETVETKTNGLKDLSTRPRIQEEDGKIHCYQVILKFDGTAYQPGKKRECECKDEGAKCTAWDE